MSSCYTNIAFNNLFILFHISYSNDRVYKLPNLQVTPLREISKHRASVTSEIPRKRSASILVKPTIVRGRRLQLEFIQPPTFLQLSRPTRAHRYARKVSRHELGMRTKQEGNPGLNEKPVQPFYRSEIRDHIALVVTSASFFFYDSFTYR